MVRSFGCGTSLKASILKRSGCYLCVPQWTLQIWQPYQFVPSMLKRWFHWQGMLQKPITHVSSVVSLSSRLLGHCRPLFSELSLSGIVLWVHHLHRICPSSFMSKVWNSQRSGVANFQPFVLLCWVCIVLFQLILYKFSLQSFLCLHLGDIVNPW